VFEGLEVVAVAQLADEDSGFEVDQVQVSLEAFLEWISGLDGFWGADGDEPSRVDDSLDLELTHIDYQALTAGVVNLHRVGARNLPCVGDDGFPVKPSHL